MRWLTRSDFWIRFGIVAGLGLRIYHWGRNPSMWHDEAVLVINIMGKGFRALLGPLLFDEAGSPLFLWIERAMYLVLGDSTFALRLVPFLASCVTLLLFVPVAKRVLVPQAVAWAVLLLAFSDTLLWHSCEAKPYAVDVFSATLLLALYCGTSNWRPQTRLVLFAALAPVLTFLTYPACFLFGGLLLALLPEVWQTRQYRTWLAYGVLTLAILVSFAVLVAGPVRAQRSAAMESCWLRSFPPWDRPWKVPFWFVDSTLDVVRYACEPTGKVLAIVAVVGGISLYRRGMQKLLVFLVAPIALALLASCVRAYPYGGARVMVYAAPAIFLLVAAGVPLCFDFFSSRLRAGTAVLLLVAAAPIGYTAWHIFYVWDRADCSGAAAYVLQHRRPDDAVTGNSWEYWYYFRNIGSAFQPSESISLPVSSRLWYVFSGASQKERTQLGSVLTRLQGRIIEQRDFDRTKVFLLDAPYDAETSLVNAEHHERLSRRITRMPE